MAPNPRLQRTRLRSPLSAKPLGRTRTLVVAVSAIIAASCSARLPYQHLVVWNQTQQPERIVIRIDDNVMYSGLLGTVDYSPAIIIDKQIGFPKGRHTLSVNVPSRGFAKSVTFIVAKTSVNLHVAVNLENVDVQVSYRDELYL